MAYTATNWVDNVTAGNHTTLNNLETQYSQATTSFERDLWTPFVMSGLVASGTVGTTTVNVTAGIAFLLQSADSTLQRRAPTSSTQTTVTPSTTYHLYLQPDGSWYWSTSNSPAANSLAVATVTTDGSGNIATITDARGLATSLFSGMLGQIKQPIGGGGGTLNWWMAWDSVNNRMDLEVAGQNSMGFALAYTDSGGVQRPGLDLDSTGAWALGPSAASPTRGSPSGIRGDASNNLTIPGNLTLSATSAVISGGKWTALPTNRSGTATSVEVYSGSGTPAGDGVTTPRTGALWAKA